MDTATKQHVLAFEDPERLREHLNGHEGIAPAMVWPSADHRELDALHIEAHRD